MRVDLGEDNTLRWALIVVAGAIALSLIAVWQGEGTRPLRRDLAWLLGGAAGMSCWSRWSRSRSGPAPAA